MKDEKKINYIAGENPYSNDESIVTNISINPDTKAEVYWFVPSTKGKSIEDLEEAIQGQYGCDLQTVIESGIRAFSTRPNYKLEIADDGTFNHDAMQALASGYKVGARTTGTGLSKVKDAMKDLGMSPADLLALIEKAKANMG